MTKEEIIQELNAMYPGSDEEACHSRADDMIYHFLKENGNQDLAKAYEDARERVGFWYA